MYCSKLRLVTPALLALVCSCSSEAIQSETDSKHPGKSNQPPVVRSASIVPHPLILSRPISAQADTSDPDGDLVTARYQWRLNDQSLVGETHAILSSVDLHRGDRLSVSVTPYDGTIEGAPVQVESVVENTPPEVTKLAFGPEEIYVGISVQAQVSATDADQDPIEYRYRWWRNDSEVADGESSELNTDTFSKGDTIVVEVTPSDPIDKGKPKRSEPMTILNSAPKITSAPPTKIERGSFVYMVTADDPDKEPLTYALEMAPPGMKIDKKTGRIDWPLLGKLSGNYKVRVTATDGDQAQAFQEFDLAFSSPKATPSRLHKNFRFSARLVRSSDALLE